MPVPKKKPNSTAVLETAINAWMGAHVKLAAVVKQLEPKLDAAKAKVIGLMQSAGLESFDSKYGKISIRRATRTDWEGLAKSLLTEDAIAAAVPNFQKEGEPYVSAPQSWAGKAK